MKIGNYKKSVCTSQSTDSTEFVKASRKKEDGTPVGLSWLSICLPLAQVRFPVP